MGCLQCRLGALAIIFLLAPTQSLHAEPSFQSSSREHAAVQAFARARRNPLLLEAFLRRMPKGGDLHMHLLGAVYAETFIKDAGEDGLCVDMETLALAPSQADPTCASGQLPAGGALSNQIWLC